MTKHSSPRRRPSPVLAALHGLATVNVAIFAAFLWLIKPFWAPIDQSLAHDLGPSLPWSSIVLAVALFGAIVSLVVLVHSWRAGRRPWVTAILTLVGAVGTNAMLFMLLQGLEKDRIMIPLRIVECAPYVGGIAGLALLMVVLPRFRFWKSAWLRWALLVIAVAVFAVVVYKPWPPSIVAGPWLEIAENDGITVSWITDRPTLGRVEYGPDWSKQAQAYRSGMSEASEIHRITLTDLDAGEPVSYRVVSQAIRAIEPYSMRLGGEVVSASHTFTVPDPDAEEVSFVFLSDLHEQMDLLPDLLKAANYKEHAFVVLNGDTLFQAHSEYQVKRFARSVSSRFASEIPFVFIRGNHDSAGAFARDLPDYMGFRDDPYAVWLRAGPAALLFLDIGDIESDREAAGLLMARQVAACDAIGSSAEWRSAPVRILCSHIGVYQGEGRFFGKQDSVCPDLQLEGHAHMTRLTDKGFPSLTASGEAWFSPETYPIYTVHVNKERIAVKKLLRTGEQAEEWEFPARRENGA
ncbi:MAG: hypothetical protein GY851_18095 [bacterium]|nr:hypothetical protein [bacterium]